MVQKTISISTIGSNARQNEKIYNPPTIFCSRNSNPIKCHLDYANPQQDKLPFTLSQLGSAPQDCSGTWHHKRKYFVLILRWACVCGMIPSHTNVTDSECSSFDLLFKKTKIKETGFGAINFESNIFLSRRST